MSVKKKKLGGSDTKFAYALLAPSIILLVLLIGYPLIYNIVISCQDVPLNPNLPSEFVGLKNFIDVFTDPTFYKSVAITLLFTVVVTSISTVLGLALSVFLNRPFVGKKLVNSIIILSYVVPAVCLIFTWRYMFNNIYGKVKVEFAAPKHGTELADFRGTTPFIDGKFDEEWRVFAKRDENEPRGIEFGDLPLGNMFVGTITEKGSDVTEYEVGDRVCSYGPIKETQIVNAVDNYKLRKMSKDASAKNAVCYDPAQFALSGIRDADVRPGDRVVVIGLGAIGLIALQLAVKIGATTVIGIDPIAKRREIATKTGAHYTLDSTACDAGLEIKRLTEKQGADVIIETSGNVHALQSALKGLAYNGTIAYVAFAKPFPEGLWLGQEAHFNYGKIIFSRACSEPNPEYPRWNRKRIEDVCWKLLMNGYLNCEDIIDPVVPFEECAEGFCKYVDQHPESSIKMGVDFS